MKIDIVGIFGVLFVVVVIVSLIWIRNLNKDIDFYKSEIDNYYAKDKTFIIVEYKLFQDKNLNAFPVEAKSQTVKIAPKESYQVVQNDDYDLIGFTVVREN